MNKVFRQGIRHGIQAGLQRVVVVDDGVIHVLVELELRQQRGFRFDQLDFHGGGGDVQLGGFQAGAFVQGQHAQLLQEQQGTAFVGGVVGHGDRYRIRQRGSQGQNQGQGQNQSNQFLHERFPPSL